MAVVEEEEGIAIPEWVVTFGDMMSLLLTFFIMLVSMSEIKEEEKYQAMVDSVRKQFGHDLATNSPVPGRARPRNSPISKLATVGRQSRQNIMKGGNPVKAPSGDHPRVMIVPSGEKTGIGSVIFFDADQANLTPFHIEQLLITVSILEGKPQKIEVRGHTSRRPVDPNSGFSDNWDLAYQRSRNTMQFLIKNGIQSDRIRMSVAGPNEPIKNSVNLGNIGQDARVEVYLIDEVVNSSPGSSEIE